MGFSRNILYVKFAFDISNLQISAALSIITTFLISWLDQSLFLFCSQDFVGPNYRDHQVFLTLLFSTHNSPLTGLP